MHILVMCDVKMYFIRISIATLADPQGKDGGATTSPTRTQPPRPIPCVHVALVR